jgi:hypothetical protein
MLCMMFWVLGNKQMFNSHVPYIQSKNSPIDPMHPLIDFSDINDLGHHIESMIMLLIVFYVLVKLFFRIRYGESVSTLKVDNESHFEMDEGLSNYYNSIKGFNQKEIYARELYYKEKYGVSTLDDEALRLVRTSNNTEAGDKIFSNVPSFNIISNNFYYDKFQFFPMYLRDDKTDFTKSDPIFRALFQAKMHQSKNYRDGEFFNTDVKQLIERS